MGRCQDIFASEKSTLQAADAQGFESPTSSQVLSIQNCVFMEKMYSKQDVVRLVALERDRCINEVYGRIKEVERLGRTKPGLKVWTRRVVDALEKVLLKVVNGKMVKGGLRGAAGGVGVSRLFRGYAGCGESHIGRLCLSFRREDDSGGV